MDFIVELPRSRNKTVVWTITDLFSKQAHYVPLREVPTAEKLVDLFMSNVFRLHGMPHKIISDRGTQFTAKFWKVFLKTVGVEPGLSTAHHPMTDGQSERSNQVLEQYLRCFVNYHQTDWVDLLPLAEYCYNNAVHSSTGMSPFKAVYGYDFGPAPLVTEVPDAPLSLSHWSKTIETTWEQLRRALDKAKSAYKDQADKRREKEPEYQIGDEVYLSTKFLRSFQPCKKLGPKFIGPFRIKRVVSEVAVELDLPKTYRGVHGVFHVSLLKPAPKNRQWHPEYRPPQPVLFDGKQRFEIEKIVDSCWRKGQLMYLVQWKHFPTCYNEWVKSADVKAISLIKQFHDMYPNKAGPGKRIETQSERVSHGGGNDVRIPSGEALLTGLSPRYVGRAPGG